MTRGTVTYSTYTTMMDMYLGDNNVEYVVAFGYGPAFKSKASFDFSIYDGKGDIHFDLVQTIGVEEEDIQELANEQLRLSFKQWDMLIRDRTGMGIRDIGFGAYDG